MRCHEPGGLCAGAALVRFGKSRAAVPERRQVRQGIVGAAELSGQLGCLQSEKDRRADVHQHR